MQLFRDASAQRSLLTHDVSHMHPSDCHCVHDAISVLITHLLLLGKRRTCNSQIQCNRHGSPCAPHFISPAHELSPHAHGLLTLTASNAIHKDIAQGCTHPFHLHSATHPTHTRAPSIIDLPSHAHCLVKAPNPQQYRRNAECSAHIHLLHSTRVPPLSQIHTPT